MWFEVEEPYSKGGSVDIEIDFDFKYYNFSHEYPNSTEITLVVENTEFYVSTDLLCSKSGYFHDQIVNENRVNDRIIHLYGDITAEKLCEFLALFYSCFEFSHSDSELYEDDVFDLATKFDVVSIHHKCEQSLMSEPFVNSARNLLLADKHGYSKPLDNCMKNLETIEDVKKLKTSAEFSSFTESTKNHIAVRLLELI